MGLDITAYRNLKPATRAPAIGDWTDDDYDRYLNFSENSHFPGTMAGLDGNAVFERPAREAEDILSFRAGSYSGYNWWRNHLCHMAHSISAEAFWALAKRPTAFAELIDYSDCEGTIGPVIAAKLARDFAEYQAKADAYVTGAETDWWRKAYATWRKAFEMAAESGAVDFH